MIHTTLRGLIISRDSTYSTHIPYPSHLKSHILFVPSLIISFPQLQMISHVTLLIIPPIIFYKNEDLLEGFLCYRGITARKMPDEVVRPEILSSTEINTN